MARLLMIVSGARAMTLADGKEHPTGYWAEEVIEPYRRLTAAGGEQVGGTPRGG